MGPIGWLVDLARRAAAVAPAAPGDVAAAGELAIAEARRLFALDVWDPPRDDDREVAERWRDEITALVSSPAGLGWTWEGRYAGDGDFEWCGAFASRCWGVAGLPLAARRTWWASCYRLQRWASYRAIDAKTPNPAPPAGAPRRLCVELTEASHQLPAGVEARPGDVLIVGGAGSGPGRHITVVESFDGEVFRTIEGNGVGLGPDGKRRQGIVRARRPLGLRAGQGPQTYHARWLIRPAATDLGSLARSG
jgi:hypothetical protein